MRGSRLLAGTLAFIFNPVVSGYIGFRVVETDDVRPCKHVGPALPHPRHRQRKRPRRKGSQDPVDQ